MKHHCHKCIPCVVGGNSTGGGDADGISDNGGGADGDGGGSAEAS